MIATGQQDVTPLFYLRKLREEVKTGFGKKCKDLSWGCPACEAYLGLELLEEAFSIDPEIPKNLVGENNE